MAVFKECHQRLPKLCWSDGCLWRVSSKTAKVLLKWWLSLKSVIEGCQSSAEVTAVFEECRRRLPILCWSDGCLSRVSSKTAQVRLKWWLSLKRVIKDCQSSAEVMAVFEECHRRLPKFCWSHGCLWRVTWPMECMSSAATTTAVAPSEMDISMSCTFRPPGVGRVEFAGGVFGRMPRIVPGRFDEVWWFDIINLSALLFGASLLAAVANSFEMKWSNPNQRIPAPCFFLQRHFFGGFGQAWRAQRWFGDVFGGRFSECFHIASRKDLIARLLLRLFPAKMALSTWLFATSYRMASIDAIRQRYRMVFSEVKL